ncbi:MAG: ABC transporter ATP-binding protein/permease [Clostridiales bacterium]|jgi:ABC-type lipoprotein export system ATPase subunit|nr:ABC transporter ATP-binding protein/permease [Clostridiales bacterium]
MLDIKSLSKTYKIKGGAGVEAVKDVSLKFGDKGFIFIVGRSGSGKTTLLNLIGGIDKPDGGEIVYNGRSLKDFSQSDFDAYRNNDVSFIFQDYYLLNDYNVIENVRLPLRMKKYDKADIDKTARAALEKVGLAELAERRVNELSGGQRQRVAIARAIAKGSPVLLCDEPTGNLDERTSDEILSLLKEVSRSKLVIMVTHHEEDSVKYGERLLRFRDGKVAEDRVIEPENGAEEGAEDSAVKPASKNHIDLKDSFKLVFGNLKRSKILAAVIFVVLAASYILFTNLLALSNFKVQSAVAESYRHNDSYVVPLTKYRSGTFDSGGRTYIGSYIIPKEVTDGDIGFVKEKADGRADVLSSYTFVKNFQDFTDGQLPYDKTLYNAFNFSEMIVVQDFGAFLQPLAFGNKPKKDSEILIYDYMAYNMLRTGAFGGVSEIRDFVGYTLTDNETGFSMTVSGILKSVYERYGYVDGVSYYDSSYTFENSYLASLQAIFCFPALKNAAQKENGEGFSSIFDAGLPESPTVGNTTIGPIEPQNGYKKLKHIRSIQGIEFIGTPPGDASAGILLSKNQFERLTGFDATEDNVNKFLSENTNPVVQGVPLISRSFFANNSNYLQKGSIISGHLEVCGIYKSNEGSYAEDQAAIDENTTIVRYYNSEMPGVPSGQFRKLYLLLGNNWKVNEKLLGDFAMEDKGETFYSDNPDYVRFDFTDYTPYSHVVYKAADYLAGVKQMGVKYRNYLVVAGALGICIFTFASIKKHKYKIGVLKSLGIRNGDIALIFGFESFLIALAAFFASIALSIVLMGEINREFTVNYSFDIVFFKLSFNDFLMTFLASIGLVLASLAAPLIKIFTTVPIKIIRHGN